MERDDTDREETYDERVKRLSAHVMKHLPDNKPKSEWSETDREAFAEFYVDENGYA